MPDHASFMWGPTPHNWKWGLVYYIYSNQYFWLGTPQLSASVHLSCVAISVAISYNWLELNIPDTIITTIAIYVASSCSSL